MGDETERSEVENSKEVDTFYKDDKGNLRQGQIVIRFTVGSPPEDPFVFIRDTETGEEFSPGNETVFVGPPEDKSKEK